MKYCVKTTSNHNIAQLHPSCITEINSLISDEGYVGSIPLFTNAEVVINLDKAEAIVAKIVGRVKKNKSMDMAFGLATANSTKKQVLMVELKFNVTDFYALRKKDLEEKVAGSTLILSNTPEIVKLYIFIFKSENLHEGVSRLCRMLPRIDSNYVAMDIANLKMKYFN